MITISTTNEDPMLAAIEEPLLSDYNVHELPPQEDSRQSCMALAARIELFSPARPSRKERGSGQTAIVELWKSKFHCLLLA